MLNLIDFFLCILSLFIINDWITIMGYSHHELSAINMLHSLKKIFILHPYLPIYNGHRSPQLPLSFVPRVVMVERFDCIYLILLNS